MQFLFNGESLNESYIIRDRSVIAVPGVSHPVVTGPVSDHVYLYGLASRSESPLIMHDVPEFKHLKAMEGVLTELEEERGVKTVTADRLRRFKEIEGFTPDQRRLLEMILAERGFRVVG